MKGNSRDNPSPHRLRLASGTPQTLHALSCTRKFVHELAFCGQVSNRPRTCLSATTADTQPRLIRCPTLAMLSAATGAGGRVCSPALLGTQPTLLPAATLGPTQPQCAPAGARAGQAPCPLTAAMGYRSKGLWAACWGSMCSRGVWPPAAGSKQPL